MSHWIDREGRTTLDGADEPGVEMCFHDKWSHSVFATAKGHQVVLGPIGIDLGTFPTQREACAVAEANARTRALNTLQSARRDIARAMAVLGALSYKAEPTEMVESS